MKMGCPVFPYKLVVALLGGVIAIAFFGFWWAWSSRKRLLFRTGASMSKVLDRGDQLRHAFELRLAAERTTAGSAYNPDDFRLVIDALDVPLFERMIKRREMRFAPGGYWRGVKVVVWELDEVKGEPCTRIVHRDYAGLRTAKGWTQRNDGWVMVH